MRLKSLASVLAPDSKRGAGAFFLPLIMGAAVMGVVAFLASRIQPVIDAAWFGVAEQEGALEESGVVWVSFFLVAAALYGMIRGASSISDFFRSQTALIWIRHFMAFLALLYWIVGIHFILVVEMSGDHTSPWLWSSIFEILLVSSVVALLWPLVFGLRSWAPARDIFLFSLATLGLGLCLSDPDVVTVVLASLGLIEEPRSLLLGSSFPMLPYLSPIGPVCWATFTGFRHPGLWL